MLRRSSVLFVTSCFVLAAFGCGGSDGNAGDGDDDGADGASDQRAGFTECGTFECQPGQHCANAACADGCLSNANCGDDETCDTESRLCVGGTAGSSSGSEPCDARFEAAVELAYECGLIDAAEAAAGKAGCSKTTAGDRAAFADCIETAGCTDGLRACFGGWQCGPGPAYACPTGHVCQQHVCY